MNDNQDFISHSEVLDLERERIKSQDKRTEIARLAIEKNDDADKRMFDFHMAKLQQDTSVKSQQVIIARNLIYGGSAVTAAIVALLLYFALFGEPDKSALAIELLSTVTKGLSGIGIYLLGKGAFNKLTSPPSEN